METMRLQTYYEVISNGGNCKSITELMPFEWDNENENNSPAVLSDVDWTKLDEIYTRSPK